MIAGSGQWHVRLTAAAENDFCNILRWTSERFGSEQARVYAETLARAIQTLAAGPEPPGSRRRDEIAERLMTLHVARGGRKGRHFVLYRIGSPAAPSVIDVVRLLHDSMDPTRHVDG